jgi:uncharacterized membrane protein YfcA
MAVPLVVTNIAPSFGIDRVIVVVRRLLPIAIGMVVGVEIGVHLLTGLEPRVWKPVVGVALIGVAALMLLSPKLCCPPRLEPVLSPFVSGVLDGLAAQSGPIVFVYLLSLGIARDRFVQYSSMYPVFSSLARTAVLCHVGAMEEAGTVTSLPARWSGSSKSSASSPYRRASHARIRAPVLQSPARADPAGSPTM